jgi:hypothetical protein
LPTIEIRIGWVRDYLPDLPSIPRIPLPDPLQNAVDWVSSKESEIVSPILRPINYLILFFSLISLITNSESGFADLVVFRPKNIVRIEGEGMIFLWTMVTSAFVETSLISLIINLVVANFIMRQNKVNLELAWGG